MEKKKAILIVDDENGVRESLRQILKPLYEVYTAESGEEAREILTSCEIDLVTLDLKMPGQSGIDILKEIRKREKNVEVVIVTAYGTFSNADEALLYGVEDFIVKPFESSQIIAIVAKCLDRKTRQKKLKSLIQEFKTLLPMGESKADDLLPIARDICEILKREDSLSTLAPEELSSFFSFASQWREKDQSRGKPQGRS